MKIGIASDHRGYVLKQTIIEMYGLDDSLEYVDFGCDSADRCVYPQFATAIAQALQAGTIDVGILLCGTGVGMSIAANRYHGIYAALCWTPELARLAKEHNNANVLIVPADYVNQDDIQDLVDGWLKATFVLEHYQERINQIDLIR